MPPPPTRAEFDATVLFVITIPALPRCEISMPPPDSAEFPVTVLLTSVMPAPTRPKGSSSSRIPPPGPLAVLSATVLFAMVSTPPPALRTPAPSSPEFRAIVLFVSVVVPW